MAEVRLTLDEVTLCIKGARLILHGIPRDAEGKIIDHVDIALPWDFNRTIANLDGVDYRSLDGQTS